MVGRGLQLDVLELGKGGWRDGDGDEGHGGWVGWLCNADRWEGFLLGGLSSRLRRALLACGKDGICGGGCGRIWLVRGKRLTCG